MKRIFAILITLAVSLLAATAVQAGVTSCISSGTTPEGTLYGQYEPCDTDQTQGSGTPVFSADGLSVTIKAKTQRGPYQTASYWASNGPVGTASSSCVTVNVTQFDIKGGGYVEQHLVVSYDGVSHDIISSVWNEGTQADYCYHGIPPTATNIWWQLITVVGGTKPSSHMEFTQTLLQVEIT